MESFVPAYLQEQRRRELPQRPRAAVDLLCCCRVCPRHCEVDRIAGQIGFCRTGRFARIASASCPLRRGRMPAWLERQRHDLLCRVTWAASSARTGTSVAATRGKRFPPRRSLAPWSLWQEKGCHNINLVTPTHVLPQLIKALASAVAQGLRIPIVYNTGAYDSLESIRLLDGLVDIYMPDFKLWSPERRGLYLNAADYAERAREVAGDAPAGGRAQVHAGRPCLPRGPGSTPDHARPVGGKPSDLRMAGRAVAGHFVNIMGQYRPEGFVCNGRHHEQFAAINRRPTAEEIKNAFALARQAGLWRFD